MKIPPEYSLTPEILELISKIDSIRMYLLSLDLPIQLRNKIHRVSILKSSLYSARIEGSNEKLEIQNILRAIEFINKGKPKKISAKIILKMHSLVMNKISSESGKFRTEPSAIFNQAGVAVYVCPHPQKIKPELERLLNYINSQTEKFAIIDAFVSHLIFEKIHPFLDGNGRAGRLLITAILKSKNSDFGIFVPFEEYLDAHKGDYYYHLDSGLKNTNDYLLFMLTAFYQQLEKVKEEIEKEQNKSVLLPPRQEEILNIIKDHKMVSFDILRRRFLKVPERTLRYDLKKLMDKNLVTKIGKTKGVYYTLKV